MSFSKNLKTHLAKKKWTVARLSRETGINKSTLHAWTLGRGNLNLEYLRKVAEALQVSVHELAYGEPDPFEAKSEEILRELFSGDVRITVHKIEKRKK